ncbi:MAG: hypothetical protein PVF17_00480 [Ignavibacteria bacterium]|jgi:hypothetical protein
MDRSGTEWKGREGSGSERKGEEWSGRERNGQDWNGFMVTWLAGLTPASPIFLYGSCDG